MKMKHVMAALLFGVVAAGAAQAQEKHYKYYPVTTEIYGEVIINTTDLDEACRLGVDSYNERWVQPSSRGRYAQVGHGKYEQRWFDDSKNGRPIRYILCAFQERVKNKDGSWGEWKDENSASFAKFSCRDGGRFLFRTKDLCAEERRGPIPEESKCDPSYYPNGIVPADCTKNKPDEKPDTPEPECSVEPPLTKEGKPAYGAVACNGEKRKACGWSNPNIEDSKAREIVKKCTLVHEGLHIKNELCYGGDCVNGYMKEADKPYNWFDEITSYQGELLCLEEKKSECLSDRNCLNGLEMAKVNAQSQMAENMNIYCDNNLEDCIKNDGVVLRCKH